MRQFLFTLNILFFYFFTKAGKMPGFPVTSLNVGDGKSATAPPPLYLNKIKIP